ncbi:hypothetical protein C8J56DRAFT_896179 [Mycena floridula]|nr:hypothetical protein C8J56DRAFT_896179 [Mycena floridula]
MAAISTLLDVTALVLLVDIDGTSTSMSMEAGMSTAIGMSAIAAVTVEKNHDADLPSASPPIRIRKIIPTPLHPLASVTFRLPSSQRRSSEAKSSAGEHDELVTQTPRV